MSVNSFDELRSHVGHKIVCVIYGEQNTALECETCGEVLLDFEVGK